MEAKSACAWSKECMCMEQGVHVHEARSEAKLFSILTGSVIFLKQFLSAFLASVPLNFSKKLTRNIAIRRS